MPTLVFVLTWSWPVCAQAKVRVALPEIVTHMCSKFSVKLFRMAKNTMETI